MAWLPVIELVTSWNHGSLLNWLVVSNIAFIFHDIWDVILPIDELIFFRGVAQHHQPDKYVQLFH